MIARGCASVCLVLLVASTAEAAVAHVQTVNAQDSNSGTTLATGSFTTGAAALLIAAVAYYDNPAITSVQLDGSTTFALNVAKVSATDGAIHGAIYSLPNVSAGSHTVTVTWASATLYKDLFVTEVSGAATTAELDGAGASNSGTSAACSSGSYAATVTSFWHGLAVAPNSVTFTAGGGGWAIPTNGTLLAGASSAVEYLANPGSSPQTAAMTITNKAWVCIGVAYKVASAPAGGARHRALVGVGH